MLVLRGERAPKKLNFLVKIYQKCLKTPFFWPFFSKICLRRRKFGQIWVFIVVSESSQNQFGRFKKKVDIFFKMFFKIRHPLKNFLVPRLYIFLVLYSFYSFWYLWNYTKLYDKLFSLNKNCMTSFFGRPGYC